MDKLNRSGSSLNLKNEDFTFLQDAFEDVLKGICSAYGIGQLDSFILSGCELTINPTTIDVAAGYVALGGEICKVDAHTVAKFNAGTDPAGYDNFWVIAPINDPSGLRAVQAGGSEDTWQSRKGKVILEDAGLNPVRFDLNIPTIHQRGADNMRVAMQSELSSLIEVMPQPTILNGWVVSVLSLVKDPFGFVHGFIAVDGSSATATQIFTLPTGWKGLTYSGGSKDDSQISIVIDQVSGTIGKIYVASFTYKSVG